MKRNKDYPATHKTIAEKKSECLELLRSTGRPKVEELINHITKMGYFEAPGSLSHHRFVGGLVSHSLETYHKAMELREQKLLQGFSPKSVPVDSIIITALMHDLCKADVLRYSYESHRVYIVKPHYGHSSRSVRQIGYSGFILTSEERDAILWHMGGKRFCNDEQERCEHFKVHPLSDIIHRADHFSIRDA